MKKNKDSKKKKIEPIKIIKNNFLVVKYVFKFVPVYIFTSILAIIANAVSAYMEILIVEKIINLVLNDVADISEVVSNLLVYIVIISVCQIARGLQYSYMARRCRHTWVKKMQRVMFEKSKYLGIECYDNPKLYDCFSRALKEGDIKGIDTFDALVRFIQSFILIITVSSYILVRNVPILFVVTLVQAIIAFSLYSRINKLRYKTDKDSEKYWRKTAYVSRTFYLPKNTDDIKATPIGDLLIAKSYEAYIDTNKAWRKPEQKMLVLRWVEDFTYQFVSGFFSYAYLMWEVHYNGMLIATFASMINAVIRFIGNFYGLARNFIALSENALYINDLMWLLEYKPTIEDNPSNFDLIKKPLLTIKNVSFRYTEEAPMVLKDISLTINHKDKIAIIGYNGAGKTTLIKLLLKFYLPTEGSIYVNNLDYSTTSTKQIRKMYSSVFQNFQIYSVSVAENILMRKSTGEEDEKRVWEALEKVELTEKIKSLPLNINTILTKEFSNDGLELSGGERQRLALARIFASDSEIVILDEPTSNLDPVSEFEINKRILDLCSDKTVIIISHRLSTVVDASMIYTIIDGQIVEKGTHFELMKKNGKYAEMFKTQSELYTNKKSA